MTTAPRKGRVAVIGAGPAGMATALSAHQAGHEIPARRLIPRMLHLMLNWGREFILRRASRMLRSR